MLLCNILYVHSMRNGKGISVVILPVSCNELVFYGDYVSEGVERKSI